MAWEMTLLDLAERAGIAVPARQLVGVGEWRALLLARFDRVAGRRLSYISAMTLVGGTDGSSYDDLEVAERLAGIGASVATDLRSPWRRIAFRLAVNNTDDHVRNHGFLRSGAGWTLSPIFDVNPDPDPLASHATSIGYAGTVAEGRDALRSNRAESGLSGETAEHVAGEVWTAVSSWRAVATRYGISPSEQDLFRDAFAPPQ